jgi:hypothetical protein
LAIVTLFFAAGLVTFAKGFAAAFLDVVGAIGFCLAPLFTGLFDLLAFDLAGALLAAFFFSASAAAALTLALAALLPGFATDFFAGAGLAFAFNGAALAFGAKAFLTAKVFLGAAFLAAAADALTFLDVDMIQASIRWRIGWRHQQFSVLAGQWGKTSCWGKHWQAVWANIWGAILAVDWPV